MSKDTHQARLLRVMRHEKTMTQQDLADHLGLESFQQISNIERGECGIPQKHWKKLSQLTTKERLLKALTNDLKDEFKGEMK